MSTQHPDNIRIPDFASRDIINGEDEIDEAYFAFSRFGIHEQMWDYEGKRVLPWVVSELLTKNPEFFQKRRLGRDVFLTFRIPNPEIDKIEAKLVPEVLDSIPRCHDTAKAFYQEDSPPVFEVILPMTTSSVQLERIYCYYKNYVVKLGNLEVFDGDVRLSEWLGEFQPEKINVIPLFEDFSSILNSSRIIEGFLDGKDVDYQRVFLARSDPALNYGMFSAVLLLNVALQRLYELENQLGIPIFPILGVGSPPFRGNFKPTNVESMLDGYRSCQTLTIQSAFKYDWPLKIVIKAVKKVNSARRGKPMDVEEDKAIYLAEKASSAYREQIPEIAKLVNMLSEYIPSRRLRKLHIGLFGYSRNIGEIHLPRAIPFCAALYSIGLPPELLGMHCLNSKDFELLSELYPSPNFEEDIRDALSFYNPDVLSVLSPKMGEQIKKTVKTIEIDYATNAEHLEITSEIIESFQHNQKLYLRELIIEAARTRRFLG
jgi:phosphoenolpyruvate carboxylase